MQKAQRRLQVLLCQTLVALTALLGLADAARATLVVGTWDPAYGSPFPNLGWRGSAKFTIDDSCLGFAGTVLVPSVGCTIGVLEAKVELFNNGAPGATLDTLDFSGITTVNSLFVDTGKVKGFDLSFSGRLSSGILEADYFGNPAYFALEMSYTGSQEIARLYFSDSAAGPLLGVNENNAIAAVATIPEPASYALVLLALAGAAATTRRRR